MKILAILAAIAVSASAAHADPVIVQTPKAPVSERDAKAYVTQLEKAVKRVCYHASAPILGSNHYVYLDCSKETRAQVAKDDPTGLYVANRTAIILAAN
jgi:hypothetical protein